MIANKSMCFCLVVLAVTSLSACHNKDDDDDAVVAAPITQTQPNFTQQVTTIANTSIDNVEAVDIDAVVVASSEDGEPVVVN